MYIKGKYKNYEHSKIHLVSHLVFNDSLYYFKVYTQSDRHFKMEFFYNSIDFKNAQYNLSERIFWANNITDHLISITIIVVTKPPLYFTHTNFPAVKDRLL